VNGATDVALDERSLDAPRREHPSLLPSSMGRLRVSQQGGIGRSAEALALARSL